MLVVCSNKEALPKNCTEFKQGSLYRHVEVSGEKLPHTVYGTSFTQKQFDKCFKLYAPIIQERILNTGFIVDGKPVNKTTFKNDVVAVHQYGRGQSKRLIAYVISSNNTFAIEPQIRDTKAQLIKEAYEIMLQLHNGDVEPFDCGEVYWLYRGIPINYQFNYDVDAQYKNLEHYNNWTKPFTL